MKHIKYLFLILSMIFIFEVVNPNQADAACTITDVNLTLGSYLSIEFLISVSILIAVISSTFSKSKSVIRDPNLGSKGFSPGTVSTIFFTDLAIAFSFLSTIKSPVRGLL